MAQRLNPPNASIMQLSQAGFDFTVPLGVIPNKIKYRGCHYVPHTDRVYLSEEFRAQRRVEAEAFLRHILEPPGAAADAHFDEAAFRVTGYVGDMVVRATERASSGALQKYASQKYPNLAALMQLPVPQHSDISTALNSSRAYEHLKHEVGIPDLDHKIIDFTLEHAIKDDYSTTPSCCLDGYLNNFLLRVTPQIRAKHFPCDFSTERIHLTAQKSGTDGVALIGMIQRRSLTLKEFFGEIDGAIDRCIQAKRIRYDGKEVNSRQDFCQIVDDVLLSGDTGTQKIINPMLLPVFVELAKTYDIYEVNRTPFVQ